MSTLPNKFQMRTEGRPGYTHTVKRNAHWDYEVNWARGFPHKVGGTPRVVWEEVEVVANISEGSWIIVDEQKAEKEVAKANVKEALPDVFHFVLTGSSDATVFKATKGEHNYVVSWKEPNGNVCQTPYPLQIVQRLVAKNDWDIVDETELKVKNPEGFYFTNSLDDKVFAKWTGKEFEFKNKVRDFDGMFSYDLLKAQLKNDHWKLYEQPTLTAEQIRLNKELNEQIAALTSSIRISEQSEEHQKRLQASYKERIDVLKAKLVEGV